MHIIRLEADNIKRLVAVAIDTNGQPVVRITGKNGQGKTSVLDALWWALGGKGAMDTKPIRDGQEKARTLVVLGTDGQPEFHVERRITAKSNELVVTNAEGLRYGTPQKILDGLLGRFFDPHAFLSMDAKKQASVLQEVAKIDLSVPEAAEAKAFAERTEIGREIKHLEGQLAAPEMKTLPEDQTTATVDPAAVAKDLEEATAQNQLRLNDLAKREQAADDMEAARQQVALLRNDLYTAEERLAQREAEYKEALAQPVVPEVDLEPIRARLATANEDNRKAQTASQREMIRTELARQRDLYQKKHDAVSTARAKRAELIAAAAFPVEGLGFEEGVITLHGIPFPQCSASERLRTAVAIAIAQDPKVKVVRITDASLFDAESRAALEEECQRHGFQIFEEIVGEGEPGVCIEDGAIKAQDGETKEETGHDQLDLS